MTARQRSVAEAASFPPSTPSGEPKEAGDAPKPLGQPAWPAEKFKDALSDNLARNLTSGEVSRPVDVLPIDFVALVSVIMGISVVLIPVAGLTARFALKPIVDALGRYFDRQATTESAKIVERRLELLETQIDDLQSSMARLLEVSEFDARLKGASDPRILARRTGDSEQD